MVSVTRGHTGDSLILLVWLLAPKRPNGDQDFGLQSSVITEQEDTTHGLRSLQSNNLNRFKINTVC